MARSEWTTRFQASGLTCMLFLASVAGQSDPSAAEPLGTHTRCAGEVPNGWTFAAEALDGRFLHVIWTGTIGQTRVSTLTFYATNADGSPVFTGTLQEAIDVSLVDLSGGSPATGSEVLVHAEDWGWFPGTCRELGRETPAGVMPAEAIRRALVGSRDASATNWLRSNGFSLVRVLELTKTGKTERWQQDPAYAVDVVFDNRFVSDVVVPVE